MERRWSYEDLIGIRMVIELKEVNHAKFADETLLLGGASYPIAQKLKVEQDIFCEINGSKLNSRKIKIYRWNITRRDMVDILRILGMTGKVQWDSFKYLGTPIFKSSPK